MDVNIQQDGSSVVISVEGDLDFTVREGFESEVRRILSRATDIVLDLGRVRFIDSSGVASLLSLCEDADAVGVKVRIRHVDQELVEILDLIGVTDVLPLEE